MDIPIQVQTTTHDKASAETIANALVQDRLAACVHIGGPITSVYRWQGALETAQEWICTIKTVHRLYPEIAARIRQLHTYEEPEIVVTRLDDGSPGYLDWLVAQVKLPDTANG